MFENSGKKNPQKMSCEITATYISFSNLLSGMMILSVDAQFPPKCASIIKQIPLLKTRSPIASYI